MKESKDSESVKKILKYFKRNQRDSKRFYKIPEDSAVAKFFSENGFG